VNALLVENLIPLTALFPPEQANLPPIRSTPHPTECELYWVNALLVENLIPLTPLFPPEQANLPPIRSTPHPTECELYWVDRDALFSYHSASESFLQRMLALCVSSHYKNTPNDLQLLSDAPAHQVFVLLGPVDVDARKLPDILAVVQVCLEGEISRESVNRSMARGESPAGDLIAWTIAQQFQVII